MANTKDEFREHEAAVIFNKHSFNSIGGISPSKYFCIPAMIEFSDAETTQLREELEAAKKEIERVKGLVTHAWDQATINCEVENGVYESDDEFKYVSLKDFKSTNNI